MYVDDGFRDTRRTTWPDRHVGREGLETSTFPGCTSTDTPESASWSLESFIDDHGLADPSQRLHGTTDASEPRHREYGDNAARCHPGAGPAGAGLHADLRLGEGGTAATTALAGVELLAR